MVASKTAQSPKKKAIDIYRRKIQKYRENSRIIISYLENIISYPEFEILGFVTEDDIKQWKEGLDLQQDKLDELEKEGTIEVWEAFSEAVEEMFLRLYKTNMKIHVKTLKHKLDDICEYLYAQREGDLLALQSFKLPGQSEVTAYYDLKREAIKLILGRLDEFSDSIDSMTIKNIRVYGEFMDKMKLFVSEFTYYESDGLNRELLFGFINEVYNLIPEPKSKPMYRWWQDKGSIGVRKNKDDS